MTQKGVHDKCVDKQHEKKVAMIIAEREKKINNTILDLHSIHSKELIKILKVNGFNFFCSFEWIIRDTKSAMLYDF